MTKLTCLAAILSCSMLAAAPVSAEDLNQPLSASKAVDLTQKMHEGMAFWPGGVPFTMERLVHYDQGYLLHRFDMGENTGTHVDAPAHFIEGNLAIDQLALADLIAPAVVIDVQDKAAENADYMLTPDDILAWEAEHGQIPANSLVILNSGWNKRFETPADYINMDDAKVMHFPGYHPDSAALLLERDVAGVGIDTLSLDFGGSKDFAFHVAMLNANKYQIENLANLDALPATGATVVVGVLPVEGGSQAQARVIGLLP